MSRPTPLMSRFLVVRRSGLRRRRLQCSGVVACAVTLALGLGAGADVAAGVCWPPPVEPATVTDPFRQPECRWCAGNRGIEYHVATGASVQAVATGRVSFSGEVAGVRYVVVELASGWKLTYGRLDSSPLRAGDVVVAAATVIGHASGEFLFGLRVDGEYTDPAPHIGRVRGRARLVPIDGRRSLPAPPGRLVCGGGVGPSR